MENPFPDVPILEATQTLTGHTNSVDTLCCIPGARTTVVSGSHDHYGKVWDLTKGQCIRSLIGHTSVFFY